MSHMSDRTLDVSMDDLTASLQVIAHTNLKGFLEFRCATPDHAASPRAQGFDVVETAQAVQSAPVRHGRRAYDSDGAEATADLSASFGDMDDRDLEAIRRPSHRLDALDETLDLSSSFGQAFRPTRPDDNSGSSSPCRMRALATLDPLERLDYCVLVMPPFRHTY